MVSILTALIGRKINFEAGIYNIYKYKRTTFYTEVVTSEDVIAYPLDHYIFYIKNEFMGTKYKMSYINFDHMSLNKILYTIKQDISLGKF